MPPTRPTSRLSDPRTRAEAHRRSVARLGLALLVVATSGCLGPPDLPPYPARLARPEGDQVVLADVSVLVFDASGSIDRQLDFPDEKAVMRSFVEGMPPGTYRNALRVLGGREDDQLPLEPFDRFELRRRTAELDWTGRETPLARIFEEYRTALETHRGRAVFVVFTDGVPTRHGKYVGIEDTLDAARRLEARHPGETCFHTVQVGGDPRGPALLEAIAGLSDCGSFRHIDALDGTDSLYAFQQAIYNGPAPPPAPPRPPPFTDLDRDGVDDRFDRCAKTPLGARVDERGCWVIEDYVFEHDSARIRSEHLDDLDAVATVLRDNPSLRVRLDGHTDDTGTADYNEGLSERRAAAVRDRLIATGIAADRLEVRGFGAARPIAPNDTPAGRQRNRRVELSVVDW
jgi:OOP family OmpA-OmpF porin